MATDENTKDADMLGKIFFHLSIMVFFLMSACTQEQGVPLRIGTNIWPGYEPLYLARDKNFISSEKIHLVEYSNSSQVIRSFRNNLIDAACLTLDEVLLLLESGEDVVLLQVMDISNGGDVIIGQNNIQHLSEIKDKRVGVEGNALGAYLITRALETIGLKRQSINIVQLGVDEHEKAFTKKEIEAVVTFDPVSSKLLAAGGNLLFDSSQIPGEIVDVLVVRKQYLQTHSATIKHLLSGWEKSLAYFKQHPEDAARVLGRRMGLDVKQTLAVYKGLILPDAELNRKLLAAKPQPELLSSAKRLSALMSEQGLINRPVDVSSLFVEP